MAQATFQFPRGFLWGAATSSHQVEGNNKNNNWWAWEQEGGRILDGSTSGLACDWWGGRWKEDFDRAAEGSQNAHRLSIEWSRVQPAPDRWDEDALDHYREMLRGLYNRGITPLVTLHHFSDPLWFQEAGGWEAEDAPRIFGVYVTRVVEALKEYATLWCTINEPNVLAVEGYLFGVWPPGKKDRESFVGAIVNLIRAHGAAFEAIRAEQPVSRIGLAINYRGLIPHRSWSPLDRWVSGLQSRLFNDIFPQALMDGEVRLLTSRKKVPGVRGTLDFLGINYFTQEDVAFSPAARRELFGRRFYPAGLELSPTGFIANRPEGMWRALKWGSGFGVPLIVTENGVEDAEDHLRPRYLIEHLHQLWRGLNAGLPVKGYFHWSLVDNFEWERGWSQRFGLWELEVETQARRKRPSADLYGAICKANSLSSETVETYAPQIFEKIFPG